MEGLREILVKTSAQQKYHHLVMAVKRLGFWSVPADIESFLYPSTRPGLTKRLQDIDLCEVIPDIKIVYIQPESTGDDLTIDFKQFARHVATFDDPISQRFAESLERWRTPAGSTPPAGRY